MALLAAYAGSLPRSLSDGEDFWKKTAMVRAGIAADQLSWVYHNFGARLSVSGLLNATFGSGTIGPTIVGGMRGTTAGVVNSGRVSEFGASTVAGLGCAQFIPTSATGKWWIGGRFKIVTAVGANAKLGIGGRSGTTATNANNTDDIMLGVKGSTSTTNYVLYASAGVAIDSGVAIDTSVHDFQAWRDGATTYVQVDNNAIVSGTARPTANCSLGVYWFEVDATQRDVDYYWIAGGTVRT